MAWRQRSIQTVTALKAGSKSDTVRTVTNF